MKSNNKKTRREKRNVRKKVKLKKAKVKRKKKKKIAQEVQGSDGKRNTVRDNDGPNTPVLRMGLQRGWVSNNFYPCIYCLTASWLVHKEKCDDSIDHQKGSF